MIGAPLKADVDMTVLFAPSDVTIAGLVEAKVGEIVSLTCTTAPSNPPAEVKWKVIGNLYRNATSKTTVASNDPPDADD